MSVPSASAGEGAGARVGLFLCSCGGTLGRVIDLDALARPARWPGAAAVEVHDLLCGAPGVAWLQERIRAGRLDRIVVAACSPLEHEATFRDAAEAAGCSRWSVQVVNLREQVDWIGGDRGEATARAERLARAGLARVALHRDLPRREVELSPDVVVVGGGPAGLAAARALAGPDRRVLLVEREFALGGLAWRLDELSPGGGCASCAVAPAVDAALHHPRIDVVTGGEVTAVRGSVGRFDVELAIRPRYVDPDGCLGCPACVEACAAGAIRLPEAGAMPYVPAIDPSACDALQGGTCRACAEACPAGAIRLDQPLAARSVHAGAIVVAIGAVPGEVNGPPGVISTWRLERSLGSGESLGAVSGADGAPPRDVLLAVTEQAAAREGGLAGEELLKLALALRRRLPGVRVRVAGGFTSPLAGHRSGSTGIEQVAGAWVEGGARLVDGRLSVTLRDGEGERIEATDLLVVHAPSRPAAGAAALARMLRVALDDRGFLVDSGASAFEPSATRVAGVFVAGAAGGPRRLPEAVRDGMAAAGAIHSSLRPGGRLLVEPLAPEVDEARCCGCATCIAACGFGAIRRDPARGKARVEPLHCRGCGGCAAACPTGAMSAPHQEREQVAAEITALLAPGSDA